MMSKNVRQLSKSSDFSIGKKSLSSLGALYIALTVCRMRLLFLALYHYGTLVLEQRAPEGSDTEHYFGNSTRV